VRVVQHGDDRRELHWQGAGSLGLTYSEAVTLSADPMRGEPRPCTAGSACAPGSAAPPPCAPPAPAQHPVKPHARQNPQTKTRAKHGPGPAARRAHARLALQRGLFLRRPLHRGAAVGQRSAQLGMLRRRRFRRLRRLRRLRLQRLHSSAASLTRGPWAASSVSVVQEERRLQRGGAVLRQCAVFFGISIGTGSHTCIM